MEGHTPPPCENFINADQRIVGGRYFQAMSVPLVAGRYFDATDRPDQPGVVIVDEFMARGLWPGQDAVGDHELQPPESCASRSLRQFALQRASGTPSFSQTARRSWLGGRCR